jgi:hypothetical protein
MSRLLAPPSRSGAKLKKRFPAHRRIGALSVGFFTLYRRGGGIGGFFCEGIDFFLTDSSLFISYLIIKPL